MRHQTGSILIIFARKMGAIPRKASTPIAPIAAALIIGRSKYTLWCYVFLLRLSSIYNKYNKRSIEP